MLRAAAKNHKHVVVLCDPSMYGELMEEMGRGQVSEDFRRRAALRVFERTAEYDAAISDYMRGEGAAAASTLPARLQMGYAKVQDLRYGENPQQQAAFYAQGSGAPFRQLQGKELSFNNLLDLEAAWRLAAAFSRPAAAVIKHTNPCGVGTAAEMAGALRLALEADSVSAFGGIIGFNREVDQECAEIIGSLFLEVIVAPSFTEEAKETFARKKNLRLIESSGLDQPLDIRTAAGGLLVQTTDSISTEGWKVVTEKQPSEEEMRALHFAWIVCAHVKSNAIVLTRDRQSVGIGAGQMSRVDSARLAVTKATSATEGCVAASDAFFPFRDGLDILADAGIRAVIQPGGSVRDDEVIAAANERGLAMVFTGERHFRH